MPNQGVYWKQEVDRAAVAIGEEVPFKVSIVEPKCGDGAERLDEPENHAERKNGFKGAITIYPLFNPPGVGARRRRLFRKARTRRFC